MFASGEKVENFRGEGGAEVESGEGKEERSGEGESSKVLGYEGPPESTNPPNPQGGQCQIF